MPEASWGRNTRTQSAFKAVAGPVWRESKSQNLLILKSIAEEDVHHRITIKFMGDRNQLVLDFI